MKKERFSLSRFIGSILNRGTPTGCELDISNELGRSLSPNWKSKRGEPTGFLVPASAFLTRNVTVSGSGPALVGKAVQQLEGVIGWSAVVRSNAQILRLRDSDVQVYHDNPLPPATWLPEIGTITEGDPNLVASVLSAKRICAQTIVSMQLLKQATSNEPFDEFIASRLKLVVSSRLDQACLYGAGAASNQPLGVINTSGTNNVTITPPVTWANIADMRFASTNYDANPDSFGFIVSPTGRQTFEKTAQFSNGALSIWSVLRNETQVSKQVNDGRIFCGIWSYLTIGVWGAGQDEDFAVDLVIDPFTLSTQGKVVLTASLFCDVAVRWPSLFSFTNANAVP